MSAQPAPVGGEPAPQGARPVPAAGTAAPPLLAAACGAGFIGLILIGLPTFLGVSAPLVNSWLAVLAGIALGTRLLRWPALLVLAAAGWHYRELAPVAAQQLRFVAVSWHSGANPALPALAGYLVLALAALGLALLYRRDRPFPTAAVGLGLLAVEWEFLDEGAREAIWPALALALAWFAAVGPAGRIPRSARGWLAPVTAGICVALIVGVVRLLPLDRPPGGLGKAGIWVETHFPTLLRIEGSTRFGPAGLGVGPERYGNPNAPPAVPYGMALTGFAQDDSRLGGPLQTSDAEALRIKVSEGAPPVIYLRGAARDLYTGRGWVSSPGSQAPQQSPGFAFGRPLPGRAYMVTIDHSQLITSNLFTVLRPVALDATFPHPWDALGNTWVPDPLPPGTAYSERVVTTSSFTGFAFRQRFGFGPPPEPPAGDLQLPAGLPARVKELARSWTADAETPRAKAEALATHLSQIPYSLDAQAPPQNQDFVDYFLFTAKQGYCTYYSSALAVMLRAVGIPSRWVEGFRVHTPPPGQETVVHDSDAHAWVEAWLGPEGWLTVDATPWGPTVRPESPAADTAAADQSQAAAAGTTDATAGGDAGDTGTTGGHRWPWTVLAACLLIALRIAWRAHRERWVERRPVESARRLWRSFERLAPRRAGQTPLELAAELAAADAGLRGPALGLAQAYGRLRYGPAGEREGAATEVRQAWRSLNAAWRRQRGWRHLLRRWVA